jgi:hypothetical protein
VRHEYDRMSVMSVDLAPWNAPVALQEIRHRRESHPLGLVPPGPCVTAVQQNAQQLDAFAVGNDGAVYLTWVVGLGHWADGTSGNPPPVPHCSRC